ncbi:MAG: Gfo/Idh/MocA family oxidoreductase [Cyclobacteriaceae bacterium]|nr:Gfo/Idh/MocA family oxidoreductase [Cyclobacteriaceae bacterium]
MHKIQWGIIGCGEVTELKSGPAFNLTEGSSLHAVMRRDAEKAKDYAERHQVPKWYADSDDLLNDPEVNAIYIATPPDTHAHYTIKALALHKPVYVEKPMALNTAECEAMLEASIKYDTPLFVAYYRRALPYFLKVKRLIEDGHIGEPMHVEIRLLQPPKEDELEGTPGWRVNPKISGGGHFHDLASHQFDFLDFLFGPIEKVEALHGNLGKLYESDDVVVAGFQAEKGNLYGAGIWSFSVPEFLKEDICIITGTEGQIRFSFFTTDYPVWLKTKTQELSFNIQHPKHVQQDLIHQVVNALRTGSHCVSTADSALRTNKILDEVCKKH